MTLTERTLKNLGFVTVSQLIALAITQLALLVLAHLLTPRDFGLYAVISVVYNLTMIAATMGIDQAAVQSKDDEQTVLSTGGVLRLSGTAAAVVITVAAAPLIADFFGIPDLTDPLRLMTVAVALSFFNFYPFVRINKNLRFRELSISRVVYASIWPVVAILGALAGWSFWSLIIALVSANLATYLVLMYFEPLRLSVRFDRGIGRKLLRFGGFSVAASFVSFLLFNLDKVAIGKLLTEDLLGAYYLAFTWGMAVPNLFTNLANSVMFPTYALIAQDQARLRNAYTKTLTYLSYASMPIGIGLAAIANIFVKGVLGAEWIEATFPLAAISIAGLLYSISSPAGNLFLAIGRPEMQLKQSIVMFVPFGILLVPAVVYLGLPGASILLLGVAGASLAWVTVAVARILGGTALSILAGLRVPLVASLAMGLGVFALSLLVPASIWGVIGLVVLGIAIYASLTYGLTRGEVFAEAKSIMKTVLNRRVK